MSNLQYAIPRSFVEKHNAFITNLGDDDIIIASADTKMSSIAELIRLSGKSLAVKHLSKNDFDRQKAHHFHVEGESTLTKGLDIDIDLADAANELSTGSEISYSEENSEIIDFVNAVFSQAVKKQANDIALETNSDELIIRFVIDGIYKEVTRVPKGAASAIIARIKIMAKLDTIIKKLPQDGAVTLSFLGKPFDTRISTLPSIYGERVSIRLLPTDDNQLGVEDLGLNEIERKKFDYLISRPKGVVLVAGPTGSGKTTSMYAAIKELNTPDRSIITIENPVEYRMNKAGIIQTQVSQDVGYTFEAGLRSIVRQYPNVILIGEIRDNETADIALQSSSTGHITFASIHTNSAAGAITRLVKMNIERHYISSALQGVISQRLVRRLCPSCKQPNVTTEEQEKALKGMLKAGSVHYSHKGCAACDYEGYKGRKAIYEFLIVDNKVREIIDAKGTEQDIEAAAIGKGESLIEKGFIQVENGITSIEEVFRVVDVDEAMAGQI